MKARRPFLSVIIPLYNEERRLKGIRLVCKYLGSQKFDSEIVVVDDGSTDTTLNRLRRMTASYQVKTITYPHNQGKGFAVKTGMLNAAGKYRLFMDVDLSTPIEEFDKFITHLKKYDVLIGSRKLKNSTMLVRQPLVREYLGRVFTILSRLTLTLPISDFTCGFKCFSARAVREIFPRQTINRWGFDAEILFIGNKKGLSIKEIPVRWRNDPGTKVRFPSDIINSLKEIVIIRFNQLRGVYD